MGEEPIVLCPGRVSVRHHVLVLVQVHAFVTLCTQENFERHERV